MKAAVRTWYITKTGHDVKLANPFEKGKPNVIIARTIKSKGLSFAEDKLEYHYWKPDAKELALAEQELDRALEVVCT